MGASLVLQLLRLRASNTGDEGLITGQGTKYPHAMWLTEKQRKKKIRSWKSRKDYSGD